MHVIIVGAGAMGCLFGGLLHEKGHKVFLTDILAEQVDTINSKGLTIETKQSQKVIRVPARFVDQLTEEPDLIIIFTKTFNTAEALKSASKLIGDKTYVLTLQNGLGNTETIERFVPREKIIAGITTFPADLIGFGHVRTSGSGQTKIMSADGRITPVLENVRKALDEAGFNCEISASVFTSIWEKVAFNAALNTMTAITRLPVGSLGAIPEGRKLALRIANEVVNVATQKGIPASVEAVTNTINKVFAEHQDHVTSMLQDILSNRKTEIEAICGAVLREADMLGVPVPTLEVVNGIVRVLEQTYSKQIR